AIVEQLIKPDPSQRFQTAAAVLEALAGLAPPPTVARQLGELVRSIAEPTASPAEVSSSRTAALGQVSPAPQYPEVVAASADAETRPSDDPFARTTLDRPSAPSSAEHGWSSTDPLQISHHDRPSPSGPTSFTDRAVWPVAPVSLPTPLAEERRR